MHRVSNLHSVRDAFIERRPEWFMQISNNHADTRNPVCALFSEPGDQIGPLTALKHIKHYAGLLISY